MGVVGGCTLHLRHSLWRGCSIAKSREGRACAILFVHLSPLGRPMVDEKNKIAHARPSEIWL